MFKFHIHGYNAISTAGTEDIWSPGSTMNIPTSAAAATIVSASANDAAAGTGARTVYIEGLDANFNIISETATLNGTSVVNLANSYLRFLRAYVATAGSGGTNAGLLSIKESTTVYASIPASKGRTQAALFTAYGNVGAWGIKKFAGNILNGAAGAAQINLWTRKNGGIWQLRSTLGLYGTGGAAMQFDFESLITIQAGEDVRLEATTGANSTTVSGALEIWGGSVTELASRF